MLKELRNQHRTIIQMVFSGFKNNEIAERLEMSACTVSQIIRSPLGQAYLEGLQDKAKEATLDVRKQLVSLNRGALETLERLLNPAEKAPHSVQLASAKDVLDRTGYKAPDKLHVDMTMQTKTDQEIDAEINAMQQSIEKTYLQSPGKQISEQETENLGSPENLNSPEAFTDEQPDENRLSVDADELNKAINQSAASGTNTNNILDAETILGSYQMLDSSGQLVNSSKEGDQQTCLGSGQLNEHPQMHNEISPNPITPEESTLIDIPVDIFHR